MSRKKIAIVLILLLAAALRLWALSDVPPGMTHDEADHGLDAWGVVQGIRPIYFPTAYGREPFFDYATAALMAFLGPIWLAGRYIAVFSSLIMIAGTYAWTRLAFNERVALLTAAGLSVNFWALMTARHALRSVTLPAIFILALYCYWRSLGKQSSVLTVAAGLLLGLSFYTYIPSRIMWALFPALMLYWLLFDRPALRQQALRTIAMLAIAGLVGFPLFYHLSTTDAEARLDDLDGPIEAAREGDFTPILNNSTGALRLFTIYGDDGPVSIRYNLPGRPLLTPIIGVLFYLGIIISIWRLFPKKDHNSFPPQAAFNEGALLPPSPETTGVRASSAYAFTLLWLIAGLSPSLITGPEAATTRAIGMQPALFIFPAIALDMAFVWIGKRRQTTDGRPEMALVTLIIACLFGYTGWNTARAYFVEWANLPDVRIQYETTRVTAIEWLNQNGDGQVAMASPRPDRFHDPSTALMTLRNPAVTLGWFNGKSDDGSSGSLLLPDSDSGTLIISSWGALHPELEKYLDGITPIETLPMRSDDLDRPVQIFKFDTAQLADTLIEQFRPTGQLQFGDHVVLLGSDIHSVNNEGMTTLHVATIWRIEQPIDGLKLFTHLSSDPTLPPLAGEDSLDVPSYYWQRGDVFIQYHQLTFPRLSLGDYEIRVGAYTQPTATTFDRLPITQNGNLQGDTVSIHRISVVQ